MHDPIRPADLDRHIALLREAVAGLEQTGVAVPTQGRLAGHAQRLEKTRDDDAYPEGDEDALREVMNALHDAAEFGYIASVLGADPGGQIAQDLQQAVAGSVSQKEEKRQPYQFQAQYFFGALLTAAEVNVGVPPAGGPDFRLPNGNMSHGIEVKAPSRPSGVQAGISKAAKQLNRGYPGMAVLDLSQVVAAKIPLVAGDSATPETLQTSLEERFHPIVDESRFRITGGEGHSPKAGYDGIWAATLLARAGQWQRVQGELVPAFGFAFSWRRYYRERGDLRYHRGTWLGDLLEKALRACFPEISVRQFD